MDESHLYFTNNSKAILVIKLKKAFFTNNEKIREKSVPITERMSRLMAWLCTKDKNCGDYQLCIVTGPNINTAGKLIRRLKNTFERRSGIYFDNKETVLF